MDTWSVWRQDDNGNEVRIKGSLSKAEARTLAAVYEARGHKQLYWIRRESDPDLEEVVERD